MFCSPSQRGALAVGQRLCPGCARSFHRVPVLPQLCVCALPARECVCVCVSLLQLLVWIKLVLNKLCSRDPGGVEWQFLLCVALILMRKCLAVLCAELQFMFTWRTTEPFLVRLAQGRVGLTLCEQGRDVGEEEWLGRCKQGLKLMFFLLFTCKGH